jgi:deoxyribodipyrimidine photo-lyase
MSNLAIWWVRRDLRLTDNQALSAAVAAGEQVAPVFVLDDKLLGSSYASPRRTAFLFAGLAALDADLRSRGSRLIVRAGDPVAELARLCAEVDASAVYAERDYSPYATRRDEAVNAALPVPLQLSEGVTVQPPAAIHKEDGAPYTVFTPFSRRWQTFGPLPRQAILPAPRQITTPAHTVAAPLPAPEPGLHDLFPAGEAEAKRRLAAFVAGDDAPVFRYGAQRNDPGSDGTARLSPYLRFGMISPRMAAVAAYEAIERARDEDARKGAQTWLSELVWREFFTAILAEFPHVRKGSFRPEYDAIRWRNDPAEFAAWCEGRTGYPLIDAAMRQLRTTGWMHNRTRMAAASFLVKDLLIDWRWGERWFMQQLLDGDPAANNGGWQWTAGTGTDAAPYFRIFNPVSQGEKFDPEGVYVRQYVAELHAVPGQYLHAPWMMPKSEQVRARCIIGQDYPAPIVDHQLARDRVLAAYKVVKGAG